MLAVAVSAVWPVVDPVAALRMGRAAARLRRVPLLAAPAIRSNSPQILS